MSETASCGQNFNTDISISNIANLVVKFNGSAIAYDPVHSSGNQWKVYISGSDIPVEGTLEFWDGTGEGATLLKTVAVTCP